MTHEHNRVARRQSGSGEWQAELHVALR
jgi:hypothetical protein